MQRQNSYVFNQTNIISTYKRQLVEVQEEESLIISRKRNSMMLMMFWKEFYLQLLVKPHGFCFAAPLLAMELVMKCFLVKPPEVALSYPLDLPKDTIFFGSCRSLNQ